MDKTYHLTSQKSREVFLSSENNDWNWFDKGYYGIKILVQNKILTETEAYYFGVIAGVSSDKYLYRMATLINEGYSPNKLKPAISRLVLLGLVEKIHINARRVDYKALYPQIDIEAMRQKIGGKSTNRRLKINQSSVENQPIVGWKSTSTKNKKNITKNTKIPSGVQVDKSPSPGGHSAQEVINLWNTITAGLLPKVIAATPERSKNILARKSLLNDLSWEEFFKLIANSDFLTGKNDRGFTAGFDWVMKPGNFVKILEGNYNNRDSRAANKTDQEAQWKKRDELNEKY